MNPGGESRDRRTEVQEAVRPTRSVAGATMISRVFGLLRDKVTVFVFPEWMCSALIWAWTIPNMFRRLFGEGALSAAMVPVLTGTEQRRGRQASHRVAGGVVSGLLLILVPLTVLALVASFLVPESWYLGAFQEERTGREAMRLLRWMLPYLVLICTAAQLQALGNLLGRFFVPSLAPALVNVLWVLGALLALGGETPDLRWVAGAVLCAGLLQILWQWSDLRRAGVIFRLASPRQPEVRDVVRRMAPMMVGLAASQFNLFVDRTVAITLAPEGAVVQLYLANRLMQLPLGLVGVALGTAVYPALARAAASKDERTLGEGLSGAVRLAAVLALPALAGLMVLGPEIQASLWLGGEYTDASVWRSGQCLIAYAPCVLLQALVLLFVRADYAADRQARVVRYGLVAVAVNILLDFLLVGPFGSVGLACATSVATLVNVLLLVLGAPALRQVDRARLLWRPGVRVVGATVVMVAALALVPVLLLESREYTHAWPAARVAFPSILLSIPLYFLALRVLGRAEWKEFATLLGRHRVAPVEENP